MEVTTADIRVVYSKVPWWAWVLCIIFGACRPIWTLLLLLLHNTFLRRSCFPECAVSIRREFLKFEILALRPGLNACLIQPMYSVIVRCDYHIKIMMLQPYCFYGNIINSTAAMTWRQLSDTAANG